MQVDAPDNPPAAQQRPSGKRRRDSDDGETTPVERKLKRQNNDVRRALWNTLYLLIYADFTGSSRSRAGRSRASQESARQRRRRQARGGNLDISVHPRFQITRSSTQL